MLPDTTNSWVPWYAAYERDAWGRATNVTDTYSAGYDDGPSPAPRSPSITALTWPRSSARKAKPSPATPTPTISSCAPPTPSAMSPLYT